MEFFDIFIAGAGPAGTIAAIELHKLGYKVLLAEKNTFPRFHIGCSLSPAIFHWLETLQLSHILDPSIIKQRNTTILLWDSKKITTKEDHNITIDRGIFDQMLTSYAANLGIPIIQPVADVQAIKNKDTTWNIQLRSTNETKYFQTKFVIEASGRNSILKTGKTSYLPPLNATYGFVPLAFQHSVLEAGEHGWYWATPYKEKCLVAFFSSPTFSQKHSSNYYTAALKKFRSASLVIPSTLESYTCNASSYYDKCPITENYIKIGDAAYTTDPISSQGVIKAIKNAVHASRVVHTILNRPEAANLALSYYNQMLQHNIQKHQQWMYHFYSSQTIFDTPFWQQYKDKDKTFPHTTPLSPPSLSANDSLCIHPDLCFAEIPVLGQKYIETKTGVYFQPTDEPFVFVENIQIALLLKEIHNRPVQEIVNFLYRKYPSLNPINLLGYLIKHRLLINKTVTNT
jgi:flavin-dependent dehydrogenase